LIRLADRLEAATKRQGMLAPPRAAVKAWRRGFEHPGTALRREKRRIERPDDLASWRDVLRLGKRGRSQRLSSESQNVPLSKRPKAL